MARLIVTHHDRRLVSAVCDRHFDGPTFPVSEKRKRAAAIFVVPSPIIARVRFMAKRHGRPRWTDRPLRTPTRKHVNGPQMDGWPDAGYTPFRGAKGTTFEGGVRVPSIAYWKGMIRPGGESDELFDLMDLFGVALNLAGVPTDKLPMDRYYDFIDPASFLLHDEGHSKRLAVYFW